MLKDFVESCVEYFIDTNMNHFQMVPSTRCICTCRIRWNHVQLLKTVNQKIILQLLSSICPFLCVRFLKKELFFQTCGFTSYLNYLCEQRLNSTGHWFWLLSLCGKNKRWVLFTSWKKVSVSCWRSWALIRFYSKHEPSCPVCCRWTNMLAGAGLVFHKANSGLVSAAEEQRASWMVRRYLLTYVRMLQPACVSAVCFPSQHMEQCVENNMWQ